MDEFEQGIDRAQKKFKSFSDNISGLSGKIDSAYKGMGDVLAPAVKGFQTVEGVGNKALNGLTTGMKALAGAGAVVAGGFAAVGKSAFDSYASYEQLVGGVETLFKDSAETVMNYADNAYKTAGMSANQYMELTTSFAASLLQSLDGNTEEAAKMADLAASDMADNWNKMGSEMRSVTDAYKGFAKQNYTMLDNLKLGYGGTKEEMQRLLSDAEKFSGIKYDLSSYADIVSAIHVIQEEMGITGTTALEASTTIQGSVQSMKGAWENFTVGIADSNQDLSGLMDKLIESVVTAGNNVVPRIQEIVNTITRAAPEFVRGFAEIIPQFAPMGIEIVKTLADGIGSQIPTLLEFGSKAIDAISSGIVQYAPKVGESVTGLLTGIVDMIGSNSESLVAAGNTIIETILSGFLTTIDTVSQYIGDFVPLIVQGFSAQHEALFSAGIEILAGIGRGIIENQEQIQSIASNTITNMVTALRDNAPDIIEGGLALLEALVGAIEENMPLIIEAGAVIIGKLIEGISTASPGVQAIIATAVLPHILKIVEVVTSIGGSVSSVASLAGNAINTVINIGGKLMGGISKLFALIAANPVVAIITGIISAVVLLYTKCEWFRDAVHAVIDAVAGFFQGAWDLIVSAWEAAGDFFGGIVDGIKSVFEGIGEFLGGLFQAAWEAVKGAWEAAVDFFSGVWEGIQGVFSVVADVLGGFFSAAWDVVSGAWEGAKEFFGNLWSNIKEKASDAASWIGDKLKSAWEGIKSVWDGAKGFFKDTFGSIMDRGREAAENVGNKLASAYEYVKEHWDEATPYFDGMWGNIKNVFGDAWDAFSSIGGNIVDGIMGGISAGWDHFVGWLGDKFNGLINWVKNLLGIHSPSKVFAGIGENMALGLAEGWNDEYTGIKRQIENGLNFGAATVGLSANYSSAARYGAQEAPQRGGTGWGNTYVTINSPKAVDGVQAAREWQKTAQRMALGYV